MGYHATDEARYRKVYRFNLLLFYIVAGGIFISLAMYGGAIAARVLS